MQTLLTILGSLLLYTAIVAGLVWFWRQLPRKGSCRWIFLAAVAFLVAVFNVFLLPFVALFVAIWFVIPRKKPWRIIYAVLLMLFYMWVMEGYSYAWYKSYYPASLSGAFTHHYEEHGELTDEFEQMNINYHGRLVAEGISLNAFGDTWGPAPIYLRADQPGVIVAVCPRTWRSSRWCYVRLTDKTQRRDWRWVKTEDELAAILEADDLKRAELGEPGRWADINWRD